MSEVDPIKDTHRTMNESLKRALEMDQQLVQDLVTAPAFPLSDKPDELLAEKPLPKEERRRKYLTTRRDPNLIAAMAAQYAQKQNLPKHKPYSREVVQFFLDGEREFGG